VPAVHRDRHGGATPSRLADLQRQLHRLAQLQPEARRRPLGKRRFLPQDQASPGPREFRGDKQVDVKRRVVVRVDLLAVARVVPMPVPTQHQNESSGVE